MLSIDINEQEIFQLLWSNLKSRSPSRSRRVILGGMLNILKVWSSNAYPTILVSRAPVSHEKVYKVTFKEKLLLCKIYENTLKCFFLICKSRENCFSTRLIICFASPFPREGKSHWEWYHPKWSRDMPTAARLLVVGSVGSDGEMLTDLIRHTFLVLPFSYFRRGKE